MPDPLDPPPGGGSDPLDTGGSGDAIVSSWASTCEVLTVTRTRTATGGYSDSVSASESIACNLAKASRYAFSESQGRMVGTTIWTCQLPLSAASTVLPGAQLRIDGGSVWNVIETDEGLSGALVLTATLERTGR